MLFLLTNDDGYRAEGLAALREALLSVGRVVTIAPAREVSGISHALTLGRPLTVETLGEDRHVIDGTPTDCVYLALARLLRERPAVCVAGINHGPNLGDDVSYSGTVGAALEGALMGLPSLAVSQVLSPDRPARFRETAALAAGVARALARGDVTLPEGTFLSMNAPATPRRGVSVTRLARRRYLDPVSAREDPRGRTYYWVGGSPRWESEPGTDHHAVHSLGHVSLTLLGTDLSLAVPGAPGRAATSRLRETLEAFHGAAPAGAPGREGPAS